MRGETAGGVAVVNKVPVHGVERKVFAVEKDGGTKAMVVMETLEAIESMHVQPQVRYSRRVHV